MRDYECKPSTFWGIHKIDEDLRDCPFQDGDTIVFEVDEEFVLDNIKYRKHNYFLDVYCMKDWHSIEKLTAHLEEI